MKTHELKCWPESYYAIISGMKTAEVRKDDRGYGAGDMLVLREWNPVTKLYPGASVRCRVVHCQPLGPYGVPGFVCLSIRVIPGSGHSPPELWPPPLAYTARVGLKNRADSQLTPMAVVP